MESAPLDTRREWLLIALLIAANILVYGQVASHSFLNYDDGQFITENEAVKKGLTGDSIGWALTSASIGWYPLTWLSHMLDVELWGLRASGHLLMQLFLHAASTCVLFLALKRLTGAAGRSLVVALLFAVHPMHVESVAWASERKDTLSTLFIVLALLAYAYGRKVVVAVLMAASLMAKQMYVTFPFLLLLIDFWPLRRLAAWKEAVKEKIPLFVLSAIGVIIAVVGQKNLDALQSVESLPVGARLANAAFAYLRYLGKLFWPTDMAVPYPMTPVSAGAAISSIVLLLGVSAAAWLYRERVPYLFTGWFWFVGTLVPVIGIIQIGAQSIADRYTYFSYIGIFIALVWGLSDLRLPHKAVVAIEATAVILLAIVAWKQTGYWKSSDTLFTHAIEVTPPNPLAEYSVGQALQLTEPDRAIPHLQRSVALIEQALRANPTAPKPDWYPQSFVAIGAAQMMKAKAATDLPTRMRHLDEATASFRRALELDPSAGQAARNIELVQQIREKSAPLRPDPRQQLDAFLNAGTALSQQGRFDEAVTQFRNAVNFAPDNVEARIYLGLGLVQAQRLGEAARELRAADKLNPAEANRYITRAMRLPEKDSNLRDFITSLGQ